MNAQSPPPTALVLETLNYNTKSTITTTTSDSKPPPSITINSCIEMDGKQLHMNSHDHSTANIRHAGQRLGLLSSLVALSKARLAMLVLSTTLAGYAMALPHATCSYSALSVMFMSPASHLPLAATLVGTGLCVAAANSLNQWMEAPFE
jgi:hypothetical protein